MRARCASSTRPASLPVSLPNTSASPRAKRARGVGRGAVGFDPPTALEREAAARKSSSDAWTHHPHRMPVVEAGALERAIVDAKAQRLDQVQRAAGSRAQARDVAGVGGDPGLDQDEMQRRIADVVRRHQALLRLGCHAFAQRTQVVDAFGRARPTARRRRDRARRVRTPLAGRRAAAADAPGSLTITSPAASTRARRPGAPRTGRQRCARQVQRRSS